jgi:hypothetical protein
VLCDAAQQGSMMQTNTRVAVRDRIVSCLLISAGKDWTRERLYMQVLLGEIMRVDTAEGSVGFAVFFSNAKPGHSIS